jgi:apolipoprotein N-acyltransferase
MLPLTVVTTFIANQGFIPFPPPILAIVSIILSLIYLLPFLLDRIVHKKLPWLLQLFFLPSLANILNLYLSKGPMGSMGYIANNLVDIKWLMQWTSVVGIFGIGFLMYLCATVIVQLITSYKQGIFDKRLFAITSIALAMIVIFGFYRLNQGKKYLIDSKSVRVAAITNEQTPLGEALYESYTGVKKVIDREMSQSDPINQTIQVAMMDFKDHADEKKYANVVTVINDQFDNLMAQAQKAADMGAKIIVVSEAEVVTVKDDEENFIKAAQRFAGENQVYFFLGMGSLIPDAIFPESPYVENKIVVIDGKGIIRDTYFKNIPVEGIDPSVPGNGKMRILETPHGRLSYAICYDTDFPDLMRQVGQLEADLLLVPTGDWKDISPYHTKTTNIRSIENGFAQVRAVSGGLSSAVDPYGNYLASDDYFEDLDHLMIADVPMKAKATYYTKFGDLSSYLSCIIIILSLTTVLYNYFLNIKKTQGLRGRTN